MASDGNWYPQQYEYTSLSSGPQGKLNEALVYIDEKATSMGRQGWKMVSHAVTWTKTVGSTFGGGGNPVQRVDLWVATCFMERPLRPGQ